MKNYAELDKELEDMIGDTGTKVPGLGVIVYRDGREVYSCFLGHRRIADDPAGCLPMERDSRFRIASVSKMFTVFTLLQLMEQGKLDLDLDVSEYLGFRLCNPQYGEVPITVRMLASHTSSLRDGKVYSIPPHLGLEEFFRPEGRYWEDGAHFAPKGQLPGKYFEYCNLNYGILGTIIEIVTGERFDLYQKGHILRQLEIQGDYVPGNFSREEFRKLGTVYQKKDAAGKWDEYGPWHGTVDDYRGIQPPRDTIALQNPYAEHVRDWYSLEDYAPGTNATIFSPTGGLRISCEELSHALEMLMNQGDYRGRQILSPASVQMMRDWEWVYHEEEQNGDTSGGSMIAYGLGMYPMIFRSFTCHVVRRILLSGGLDMGRMGGAGTARLSGAEKLDYFVGHAGEAFGLLSMLAFRPGSGVGFLYVMNGEAVAEDTDERSRGMFSSDYIWEEKATDAICRHVFMDDADI